MRWRSDGAREDRVVARLHLPAVSGVLLALSLPPFHSLLLPFVALAPLGVWVSGLPDDRRGLALSLRGGAVLGLVYFGLLFYWVPLALGTADPSVLGMVVALGAYSVIVAGLAALTSLFVGLLHHGHRGLEAPLWLSVAVSWTALEWTRAHLPGSLALPWMDLGTSLTAFPEVVGMAELVGSRGIGFWLAAVSGLIAEAWVRGTRGRGPGPARAIVTAALVVAVPVAGGFWRAATLTTSPVATVAVVQPDLGGRTKVRQGEASELREDALPTVLDDTGPEVDDDATRQGVRGAYALAPGASDLVVLPELFFRGDPGSAAAADVMTRLRRFSERVGAPVLFGAMGVDEAVGFEGAAGVDEAMVPFNSAFLVDAAGLSDFRYDKRRLVPLVERMPFGAVGKGATGGYGVGQGWPLAEVDGVRYGVLICYESSYPESARALRKAGTDVLVNITNDAWLGGRHPLLRTTALWQHPAHLVMRAIEGRVGVVRAANTGISLFVDPIGRVHEETDLFSRAIGIASVRTTHPPTLYVRFGDLVGNACAVGALALLVLALRSHLRWPPSLDPPGSRV